jgi:tyrosyl-tRNA synthetase
MNDIDELVERGVANIIPNKSVLLGKLRAGKKLNVYFGIDPTSTKIHLGHAVPLRKLQKLAEKGHNVTFLIGDFTALIGDTSDKDSERPALTTAEIEENFKTYKKQAEKILDFSKIKIEYNSKWLKKLTFEDILKLTQHFSTGDFVGRELIKKRLSDNKRVGLHELLYPVMQGYDSFMLNTDLQIGGTDQTFNMQAGRTLIKDIKNKESFVLTTPILEGTDGRKMSKSWGNAIWLDDEGYEMFRKVMAIPDELLLSYFLLATNLKISEIKEYEKRLTKNENPINIKKELAHIIVAELHNEKTAKDAESEFEKLVQNKEVPSEIIEKIIKDNLTSSETLITVGFAESKSEAKRLIEQGGVSLDDKKITDPDAKLSSGLLKVGKKRFIKIVIK